MPKDRLNNIGQVIDFRIKEAKYCSLLNLNNLRLEELPKAAFNLDKLKVLFLDNNKISKLPLDFPLIFPELKYFSIRNNPLTSMPQAILEMPSLQIVREKIPELRAVLEKYSHVHDPDNSSRPLFEHLEDYDDFKNRINQLAHHCPGKRTPDKYKNDLRRLAIDTKGASLDLPSEIIWLGPLAINHYKNLFFNGAK